MPLSTIGAAALWQCADGALAQTPMPAGNQLCWEHVTAFKQLPKCFQSCACQKCWHSPLAPLLSQNTHIHTFGVPLLAIPFLYIYLFKMNTNMKWSLVSFSVKTFNPRMGWRCLKSKIPFHFSLFFLFLDHFYFAVLSLSISVPYCVRMLEGEQPSKKSVLFFSSVRSK